MDIAWPDVGAPRGLPDGTVYTISLDRKLWAIGPDGKVAAPLNMSLSLGRWPRSALMRRAEGKAWFAQAGRLLVLDAGGRTVLTRPLPEDIEGAVPLKDGFLITTKRSAFFSNWDGNLRPVENPR